MVDSYHNPSHNSLTVNYLAPIEEIKNTSKKAIFQRQIIRIKKDEKG